MLPDVKLTWRDVWPGSVVATFLMDLGGLVIGLYFKLGHQLGLQCSWCGCGPDDRDLLLCSNIFVQRNH
jgi:hypothetical protein